MHRSTLLWQLYVSAYTFFAGLPLLILPDSALPMLGFAPTGEPWVRLTGMFLLVLSYFTYSIYRNKIEAMVIHTIRVRAGITVVLLVMVFTGNNPLFFLVLSGIVLTGVVGSFVSYRKKAIE